mmetsp:Transcript_67539/g.209419  ORF Transcript_67539/g.209419 Transcript_67539/m.209419 type:complete len:362 (-) Transcript_67539:274-1359(-)
MHRCRHLRAHGRGGPRGGALRGPLLPASGRVLHVQRHVLLRAGLTAAHLRLRVPLHLLRDRRAHGPDGRREPAHGLPHRRCRPQPQPRGLPGPGLLGGAGHHGARVRRGVPPAALGAALALRVPRRAGGPGPRDLRRGRGRQDERDGHRRHDRAEGRHRAHRDLRGREHGGHQPLGAGLPARPLRHAGGRGHAELRLHRLRRHRQRGRGVRGSPTGRARGHRGCALVLRAPLPLHVHGALRHAELQRDGPLGARVQRVRAAGDAAGGLGHQRRRFRRHADGPAGGPLRPEQDLLRVGPRPHGPRGAPGHAEVRRLVRRLRSAAGGLPGLAAVGLRLEHWGAPLLQHDGGLRAPHQLLRPRL